MMMMMMIGMWLKKHVLYKDYIMLAYNVFA